MLYTCRPTFYRDVRGSPTAAGVAGLRPARGARWPAVPANRYRGVTAGRHGTGVRPAAQLSPGRGHAAPYRARRPVYR